VTFLLDTMIVSYFQRTGREESLCHAAATCPMAVVGEVYEELRAAPHTGGAPFAQWFAMSGIDVHHIHLDSPAQRHLTQLVNPAVPAKGLGERASIALAASNADLTFVTHDKNAMWLASREIWEPGERILGVAVFLRRLLEKKAIDDIAVLDDVISEIDAAHRPTWWPAWRAAAAA
jgi:hypothetical protein